nr:MAG TPA: hypothetical protein [Caudoviricetes sp.]
MMPLGVELCSLGTIIVYTIMLLVSTVFLKKMKKLFF